MIRVGSRIKAKLIEAIDEDHWIVSFNGHLLQVRNSASIKFEAGAMLSLQVEKINPIQLRVLGPYKGPRKTLNIIA